MKWTRELCYKRYEQWSHEELCEIEKRVNQSPWRVNYHIEPSTGLLNDPNGFCYFNGTWIVFFQHFPFGATHGLKSWVQLKSDDLVHFSPTGLKILPDTKFDSHGAYSGSALQIKDKLFIFYTGNVRDRQWKRHTYQLGALIDKQGHLKKLKTPLINQPMDTTDHFRDPQIFMYHNQYYAVIGAQTIKRQGTIQLYKSHENDYGTWEKVGELDFSNDYTSYMIECPNLVFVDQVPVLIYCPQGLDKDVCSYKNIYPNVYKIGSSFIPEKSRITSISQPQLLDWGFDIYATQAFNTEDNRVLAISWIGLPDTSYPTDRYNYQGILSLVKELRIKDGKLYQYPVSSIKELRVSQKPLCNIAQTNNCYELEVHLQANSTNVITLFADGDGKGLTLTFDIKHNSVKVDRSGVGEEFAKEYGSTRTCFIDNQATTVNIFIDNSVFEMFINKGEKVFSGRVFPYSRHNGITTNGNITGTYYELDYGYKTY